MSRLGALLVGLAVAGCGPRMVVGDASLDEVPEAPVQDSRELAELLPQAVLHEHYEVLRGLCTPEFRADPTGCENLWQQCTTKQLRLELRDRRTSRRGDDHRSLFAYDVFRGRRRVDRIYIYALLDKELWRVDAVDESERHARLFLDGVLPARFSVEELSGDPTLDTLGAAVLTAPGTGAPPAGLRMSGEAWAQLLRLVGPRLRSTHVHRELGRAVMLFEDTRGALLGLYLTREGAEWRVYETTLDRVSMRAFLKDVMVRP